MGSSRDASIASRYLGLDGCGGGTLRSVGDEFNLTYERVRQIVCSASRILCSDPAVKACLTSVIGFVSNSIPTTATDLESALQADRFTRDRFRLEGIIRAARLLGMRLPFSISVVGSERVVHTREIKSVDRIVRVARTLAAHFGASTVEDVFRRLRRPKESLFERDLIATVLICAPDIYWLNEKQSVFSFLNATKNRVLIRVRQVVSVANPISLTDLWAGVARSFPRREFSLDEKALGALCLRAPGVSVRADVVEARPRINPANVLGKTDYRLFQILSANGMMSRGDLSKLCLVDGISQPVIDQRLCYSAVIHRYSHNSYGLIGRRESNIRRSRLRYPRISSAGPALTGIDRNGMEARGD